MSIPPQAPMIGRRAFSFDESSPTMISRFISSPTERKKIAMRKSLMTAPSDIACPPWLNRLKLPAEKWTGFCHNAAYHSLMIGVFAKIKASTVKNIRTILELTCLLNLLRKL